MFLNRLSNEQKELFLDICLHASKADNEFADEEKLTIEQYCEEMHIDVRFEEQATVDEAAEKLLEISTPTDLKIILLETASLLLADNEYDESEKCFFESFTAKLGLTKEQLDGVFALLGELTEIYSKINEFVFG